MHIESPKKTIDKSPETIYNFLNDVNNYKKLMPDSISKFEILNEKRFLEFITDKKLGLTLYKGDRDDLTNWKQLKLKNDNTIQIKDCN